jgi:hypothetical protein
MPIRRNSRATKSVETAPALENINEENTVTQPQFEEPSFADAAPTEEHPDVVDAENQNTDFDVDTPEAEDVVAEPVAEGTSAAPKAKEKKESTRPPVPEGKVSPVAFAKILSEHKTKQAREKDPEAAEVTIAPQVVYSYIKNNGEGSKNPFPATKSEGRAAVVDADAAIAWWDAKDARVAESKKAAAEKAAKKAEKATAKPAEGVTAVEEPQAELVEAE